MPQPRIKLTLIPATGAAPEDLEKLQQEFEELPLSKTVSMPIEKTEQRMGLFFPGHLPPSSLEWIKVATTPLATALGAWLHAHYGGKVRVKVGDIEAEARTPEELEKILDKVQEIRERTEPKRILP